MSTLSDDLSFVFFLKYDAIEQLSHSTNAEKWEVLTYKNHEKTYVNGNTCWDNNNNSWKVLNEILETFGKFFAK